MSIEHGEGSISICISGRSNASQTSPVDAGQGCAEFLADLRHFAVAPERGGRHVLDGLHQVLRPAPAAASTLMTFW